MANDHKSTLSMDASGFVHAVDESADKVDKLTDNINDANKAIKENKDVTDKAKRSVEEIAKAQQTAKEKLKQLNEERKQAYLQQKRMNELTTTAKGVMQTLTGSFGSSVAALGKMGGALAAATLAYEAFNVGIKSSQTLSDAWNNTMESLKTTTGELAYAIANFDFSAFSNGLGDIIRKAKDAAAAMDQLGNTKMSYGLISQREAYEFNEAMVTASDKSKTKEERLNAAEAAQDAVNKMRDSAVEYQNAIVDATQKAVASTTALKPEDISMDDVYRVMAMDATKGRDAMKAQAQKDYEAYQKELKELKGKHTEVEYQGTTMAGTPMYTTRTRDAKGYETALNSLNAKYKDAVIYNQLLNKYTDEELQGLMQQVGAYYTINQQADNLQRTLNATVNQINGVNTGGGGGKKPFDPLDAMVPVSMDVRIKPVNMEEILNTELPKEIEEEIEVDVTPYIVMNREVSSVDLDQYSDRLKTMSKTAETAKKKIEELKQMLSIAVDPAAIQSIKTLMEYWQGIFDKNNIPEVSDDISDAQKALDEFKSKAQETQMEISAISSLMGSLGAVFSATGDDGLEMAGKILNGVQQMISAMGTLQAFQDAQTEAKMANDIKQQTSNKKTMMSEQGKAVGELMGSFKPSNPYEAIAQMAIILGLVATVVSTIASFGNFANGGVIGGGSYVGDKLALGVAHVNSGEMILNGSQQKNLFDILDGKKRYSGEILQGDVRFEVEGSRLVGVLSNYDKKHKRV